MSVVKLLAHDDPRPSSCELATCATDHRYMLMENLKTLLSDVRLS